MIFINLPDITAKIGKEETKNSDPLRSLVKKPKIKIKPDEDPQIVFLYLDLKQRLIGFESPIPFSENLLFKYNFFGNNSAASSQYYLVRETDSLYYLLSCVWNDLMLSLAQYGLQDSDLYRWIKEVESTGLILLGTKKGDGRVRLERFALPLQQQPVTMTLEKKKIIIGDKEFSFEQLIRMSLNSTNKAHRFVLVVPLVRLDDGKDIVLSTLPEYIELVKRINKLDEAISESDEVLHNIIKRTCYVCHQTKPDVSSTYSRMFSRSSINKIFTTTTINSAKSINKAGYDDAYSVCNSCYKDLLAGESIIKERFQGRIARESAFILPEGIFEEFDYENLYKLKESADFAFKCKDADEWIKFIEADTTFWQAQKFYSINFIIYRSDGNSVNILEAIEDVTTLRFSRVMEFLQENARQLKPHLKGMSLSSIYRIIPVSESKKGSKKIQVDVGRILGMYKVLLSGGLINRSTLFAYASDALDKGMRQLVKSKIDNYENMGLNSYTQGKEDFFIKDIVMSYLALFRTCQQLDVLDEQILNLKNKEGKIMPDEEVIAGQNKTEQSLIAMDNFLESQGFKRQAKALFYLGALIRRVAIEQFKKEHKTKPILKKITFQGMTQKDIQRLYEDVIEKLHQYNKLTFFAERLMSKFHEYFGSLEEKWLLDEHANVFYLMAGYAYLVGNKPPDMTQEEQKLQEEEVEEENE